jgi:hypothetical protein
LVEAPERLVERERRKVARDGWGARLLARQDLKGTWAGGLSAAMGLRRGLFHRLVDLPSANFQVTTVSDSGLLRMSAADRHVVH